MLAIAIEIDKSRITIEDFIAAEAQNRTCNKLAKKVCIANTSFDTGTKVLFIRTSLIDQGQKVVVPMYLDKRVLYLVHHLLLEGNPGVTKI